MKTIFLTLAFAAITPALFGQDVLTLSPAATSFTWTGKKVTGEHTGAISPAKGAFYVSKGTLTGGEMAIDMKTITCTDMQGEYADKLVGHLHSDDFFSTEKFPVASLKITKVEELKGAKDNYTHNITGDLTIKGKTHPISFPAVITIQGKNLAAAGEIKVDRTLYDIRYGSTSFFDDLGDKAIDNEFLIRFKVGAKG